MICQFCRGKLIISQFVFHSNYSCFNPTCLREDMSRFEINFQNYPTKIISKSFIIKNVYLQIFYEENKTIISELAGYILLHPTVINHITIINWEMNEEQIYDKIKCWLTFA